MSFLLRSSHFTKSLSFVLRKITLKTSTLSHLFLLPSTSAVSAKSLGADILFQPFVTQASNKTISQSSPLDSSIRELDSAARKIGRVSAKEIKNVLSSLNKSNLPTTTQALMLIRCCGRLLPEETPSTRSQIVQNLWQTFLNLNISLDVSHYNALLQVYLENEFPFSPTEFLTELETNGIEPNRVTYQRLVAKFCQDCDIEGATKILEFMKDNNLPIGEGIFNALIHGHSQCNDMESAENILSMMSQSGFEPTPQSYITLMCGFAKNGDIESIKRIMGKCEGSLVNADYFELIYALAVNGHSQVVEEFINKISPGVGYSADASNHILHLVNKGLIDTAYLIVKTISQPTTKNGEPLPTGGFLIRHLVRTNQSVDKILSVCQRLTDDNLHPFPLNVAVHYAIEVANFNTLVALLRNFKTRGGEVKPHFFWPLLVREGKQNNIAEVLCILQEAHSEFGIPHNQETIRDYVLPYLSPPQKVSSEVFSQLRSIGVTMGVVTSAYVGHMLTQHQLREAARVAVAFRARYQKHEIRKLLTSAYLRTQDTKSLVTVVKAVASLEEKEEEEEVDKSKEIEPDSIERTLIKIDTVFSGNILLDVFNATTRNENHVQHLELLLDVLVNEDLPISRFAREYIQNRLQSAMTPIISEALSTLTSKEITSKPLKYVPSQFVPKNQKMNVEKTLENIKKLESQGENTGGLKRALFMNFLRHKELDKALEYLKVLEQDPNFSINPGLYVLMIDLAASEDNLEVVEQYLNELNTKHPEDKIDPSKILKVANLFVNHGKEAEMWELLRRHGHSLKDPPKEYNSVGAWQLLNTLAEKTNPENVKKLLDLLKTNNYVQPNNVILGSLIKAHILKEDYTGAMESFEWCVSQYRATPWKAELSRHFIQTGDTASLQRIADLSTTIHGELNSLYDLMFCFLDSGRLRQARKILETPGMRMRPERMQQIVEFYMNNKSVEKIENFLKVTQDLPGFDRDGIYVQLLNLHAADNDVDKALALWTQLQEDNETPSNHFLIELAKLLKKNNRPIPFTVPKYEPDTSTSTSTRSQREPDGIAIENDISTDSKLRRFLKAGQVKNALKVYGSNQSNLNTVSCLQLVSSLSKAGHKPEAHQIINTFTSDDLEQPRAIKSIKSLLNTLPSEELNLLSNKFSENMRRRVSFNTYLVKTAVREGKGSQYVANVKSELEVAEGNQEKLQAVTASLPISGVLLLLNSNPELLPEISEIGHKLAKVGSFDCLQGLFNHYYINGLIAEAENIFETHLLTSGAPFKVRSILRYVEKSQDLSLAEPLLDMLKKLKNPYTNDHIYSILFGIALNQKNLPTAISLVTRVADVGASVYSSQLDKLLALASHSGETIPLALVNKLKLKSPQERNETDSSSSSSDEEETKKKQRN